MKDLKELRNKRGKAIADARALLTTAEEEKRELTAEEELQYDSLIEESQRHKKDIDREERQLELERQAAEEELRLKDDGGEKQEERDASTAHNATPEYREAFVKVIRGGMNSLTVDEQRALSSGIDTEGGYLLMPEQTIKDILKGVDDMVFIRQKATKFQVPTAESLGVPTLDADPDDADWTTELATGDEDSSMAFGKRKLHPHPYAKRIKVSRDLLKRLPGVEAFVKARLSYKFGITEEKGFLLGSGAGQPLGLFTASNDGIPTTRDVSADNSATAPTFNGLINAKYSLKGQYWGKADWMFHRDCLKIISKITDSEGQYVWRESVRTGEPDKLLGRPFYMSEYVPNTFTTGQYVGILGDFSYYWIADALDMEIQRLVELYAETNQVGLIGRKKSDGQPVLAEAFARVKLG